MKSDIILAGVGGLGLHFVTPEQEWNFRIMEVRN